MTLHYKTKWYNFPIKAVCAKIINLKPCILQRPLSYPPFCFHPTSKFQLINLQYIQLSGSYCHLLPLIPTQSTIHYLYSKRAIFFNVPGLSASSSSLSSCSSGWWASSCKLAGWSSSVSEGGGVEHKCSPMTLEDCIPLASKWKWNISRKTHNWHSCAKKIPMG